MSLLSRWGYFTYQLKTLFLSSLYKASLDHHRIDNNLPDMARLILQYSQFLIFDSSSSRVLIRMRMTLSRQ